MPLLHSPPPLYPCPCSPASCWHGLWTAAASLSRSPCPSGWLCMRCPSYRPTVSELSCTLLLAGLRDRS